MKKTVDEFGNLVCMGLIKPEYVSDDCVQVMLGYTKNMSVFGMQGLQFHSEEIGNIITNGYVLDDRRFQFPYSDRPTHYTKKLFCPKVFYVNQLFDFGKPYIVVKDGCIEKIELYQTQQKRTVLFDSFLIPGEEEAERFYIESGKVVQFINEKTRPQVGYQRFIIESTGRLLNLEECAVASFRDFLDREGINYTYENNVLRCCVDKIKIPNNLLFIDDNYVYVIQTNGEKIEAQVIEIMGIDRYMCRLIFRTLNFELFDYYPDKWLEQTPFLEEPIFTKRLNRKNIKSKL